MAKQRFIVGSFLSSRRVSSHAPIHQIPVAGFFPLTAADRDALAVGQEQLVPLHPVDIAHVDDVTLMDPKELLR